MADPTITMLPAAPLYAMEIWSRPHEVADRLREALGAPLPSAGWSLLRNGLILLRFEPAVWLAEGDVSVLDEHLGEDGALTAIGGGIVRVRIAGPRWRTLLMEAGAFDAESPTFAPGCCAATIIDHVAVRLWVESDDSCLAYIPASYAVSLIHFWEQALPSLAA